VPLAREAQEIAVGQETGDENADEPNDKGMDTGKAHVGSSS